MRKICNNRSLALLCLIILVVSLFCTMSFQFSSLLTTDATSAKGMCVMEAGSKRVLYSQNENAKLPMASTTKIMTAITAIENCDNLDKTFEISPKSVGISGTSLYLRKGEIMSTRDLLYGLMLISGNDASVAIAEHISGSSKKFIELMNVTAKRIGAENTHFDNTHGLDSDTHYTSAYDLALITSYAMENDTFREIVSTPNKKIINSDGKVRYLKNKNKLLSRLDGCCGVKTGFTNDAGRCLVSSCERDGMTVVCVVLNCGPMFEESEELLEKAFSEYQLFNLTKNYSYGESINVLNGKTLKVKIGTKEKFLYPLKTEELTKVDYVYNIKESIEAPTNIGDEVGDIKIFIDNNLQFTEKVFTMECVRRNSVWSKLKDFIDRW